MSTKISCVRYNTTYLMVLDLNRLLSTGEMCLTMLLCSQFNISNATAAWWFSRGDMSLYRSASSVLAFTCNTGSWFIYVK